MQRFALVAICAFVLASCKTAVDPFVPYPERPTDQSEPALDSKYTLDRAMARLYKARSTLQDYAEEQARILAASKGGVFGGALGALASGLYGGSRDLIVGFGLGGGGSYALGQLYGPAGYAAAYRSGLRALSCIDETASPVRAAIIMVRQPRKELSDSISSLDALVGKASKHSDAARSPLASAITESHKTLEEASKAGASADKILLIEEPVAARVNRATDRIVDDVNARIEAQQPDAAAAAALARSIGTLGLAGIADAKAATFRLGGEIRQPRVVTEGVRPTVKSEAQRLAEELGVAKQRVESAIAVLSDAVTKHAATTEDAIRLALAACKLDDVSVATLTKSPAGNVELEGSKTYGFTISGGQAPYGLTVLGTPPEGIEFTPPVSWNGSFTIKTSAKWTKNAEANIEIRDSGSKSPAKLGFTVKPPAANE